MYSQWGLWRSGGFWDLVDGKSYPYATPYMFGHTSGGGSVWQEFKLGTTIKTCKKPSKTWLITFHSPLLYILLVFTLTYRILTEY